jgi:hypothetical protein
VRLQQHINEESLFDDIVDAFYNIINNCQPFLKEMGTVKPPQFLYSGRKSNLGWFTKDVRSDRKPLDMFVDIYKSFDDAFNKKFGWRARSNGLFCVGRMESAEEYAEPYVIFPKGHFKIIWSDDIDDLYMKLSNDISFSVKRSNGIKKLFTQEIEYENKLNKSPWSPKQVQEKIDERYNKFINDIVDMYQDDNIMKAIDSQKEIMLNCKSYYAVKWNLYYIELRSFFKNYNNNYNLSKEEIGHIVAYNAGYKI